MTQNNYEFIAIHKLVCMAIKEFIKEKQTEEISKLRELMGKYPGIVGESGN